MRKFGAVLAASLLLCVPSAYAEVWQARYGVAETFNFKLYNADGTLDVDEADGGTEVSLSCNEGAETTATNDFVDEGTFYSIALTSGEMNCERIAVVVAATTTEVFFIQTSANASAMTPTYEANIASVTTGAITAAAIATDAIGAAEVAADVSTELLTGLANLAVNVAQVSGDSTAADNLETAYDDTAGAVRWQGISDQGTAQAATGTTLQLRSAAAFADDELVGQTINITGGTTGVGQSRTITDYVASTDTATVETWTTTPTGTITYKVHATAPSSGGGGGLDAAGVRAAIGLASANLDTQLTAIDDYVDTEVAAILDDTGTSGVQIPSGEIVAATFGAGAIDATAIAADAIGASELATDAIGAAELAASAIGASELADGGITSTEFGTGAITATVVAADAIGASELAADAVAEVADAVWDEDATAHQTQGTYGQAIGDPAADTDTIWALANTNLNATVSSRASQTSVDTIDDFVDTEVAAILDDTGTSGVVIASGAITAAVVATGAIDADAVAADAIGASELAADAIGASELAADAIASSELASTAMDEIVDGVWNEVQSGHNTAGSFGLYVDAAISGVSTGGVSAATIADAVWDEVLSGHTTTGTAGDSLADAAAGGGGGGLDAAGVRAAIGLASANLDTQLAAIDDYVDTEVAEILVDTGTTLDDLVDDLETRITATRAGYMDNLSAGAVATASALSTVDDYVDTEVAAIVTLLGTPAGASVSADLAAIEAQTDDIGAAGAGLTAVAWNAAWDAEVQSEATDALNALTLSEPTGKPAWGVSTFPQWLAWIGAWNRNEVQQTSTTKRLRNDADSSNIVTCAVSDDGTTFEVAECSP